LIYDINATDSDNDLITFTDNSSDFNISSTGLINWTPNALDNYSISINASDSSDTSTGWIIISVIGTTAPVATASIGGDTGNSGTGGTVFFGSPCNLEWNCQGWGECINGKRERQCTLVESDNVIRSQTQCKYDLYKPATVENCAIVSKEVEESCSDGIKNQEEEGIDCGGICELCEVLLNETKEEPQLDQITGAFVFIQRFKGKSTSFAILLLILALIIAFFLYRRRYIIRKRKSYLEDL